MLTYRKGTLFLDSKAIDYIFAIIRNNFACNILVTCYSNSLESVSGLRNSYTVNTLHTKLASFSLHIWVSPWWHALNQLTCESCLDNHDDDDEIHHKSSVFCHHPPVSTWKKHKSCTETYHHTLTHIQAKLPASSRLQYSETGRGSRRQSRTTGITGKKGY